MSTTKALIMAPAAFTLDNTENIPLTFEAGDYKVTVDSNSPKAISPEFPEAGDIAFSLTFGDFPTIFLGLRSSDTANDVISVHLNGWRFQKAESVYFLTYPDTHLSLEVIVTEVQSPPTIGILIVGTTDAGDPPVSFTSEKQINPEQIIAPSNFTLQHPLKSAEFVFKSGDIKAVLHRDESSITVGPFDEAAEVPFDLTYAGFPTLFLKLTESDSGNSIEPVALNGWRHDTESAYTIGDRVSGFRKFTVTIFPEVSEPPTIGILIVGTTDADPELSLIHI